jgi:uncharacterized sporulation protein YeaH/YhbH (DUF444 family)
LSVILRFTASDYLFGKGDNRRRQGDKKKRQGDKRKRQGDKETIGKDKETRGKDKETRGEYKETTPCPLYCLSFLDLQLLIISLVSSIFSCSKSIIK